MLKVKAELVFILKKYELTIKYYKNGRTKRDSVKGI